MIKMLNVIDAVSKKEQAEVRKQGKSSQVVTLSQFSTTVLTALGLCRKA